MKTNLLMSTIAATLMLGAIAPQSAKAEILMKVMYQEGQWFLTVPDPDTTVSAYGGRLRLYDVHIAKMIEVTHSRCSSPRRAGASPKKNGLRIEKYHWLYSSAQGWGDMGYFPITCKLAQSLVNTYGLGKAESTTIWYEVSSAVMGTRTEMIPILDIRGEEIDEWMSFTSRFKPR